MTIIEICKKKILDKLWPVYLIIFSIILTPSIKIKLFPAFRIEQLIVVIFLIYTFITLILEKKMLKFDNKFPLLYACFSIFIIISTLVGFIKGIRVTPNDFFELYKILIYLGIYLITFTYVQNEEDKIKIINFMITCLLISVFISVQQYFNLFNLNEKYVPLIAPTQYKTLINNYPTPRVIGMTSNPNVYAVMPGIGAIISWGMYLYANKKVYIFYMAIFILGVFMTLSRSGFAFMLTGIVIFTYLYLYKYHFGIMKFNNSTGKRKLIRSIVVLILIGVIIFYCLPEKITWRFKSGINIKSDRSFQMRFKNWTEHIHYFKQSPILGIGPAKSVKFMSYVDNEWLLLLKRYGIAGCFYLVCTFAFPFLYSKDIFFKYVYFSILVGCSIYMIPANIYHSFQTMPLVMIIAGLVSNNYLDKE